VEDSGGDDDPMKGKIAGRALGGQLTAMEKQVCGVYVGGVMGGAAGVTRCLCEQVVALKRANPGVMLMVECGYRFRFFGEDALEVRKRQGSHVMCGA
jgi:hypothetical protein